MEEVISIEKSTGLCRNVFTNQKGKDIEEYFLQFKQNGYCVFLNGSNGMFSCSIYEARPEICKNYPSKPGQKDLCASHIQKNQGNIPG